jgi:hypothetical protein
VVSLTDAAFCARWGEPLLPPGSPRKGTWLNRHYDGRIYAAFESSSVEGEEHTPVDRIRGRWLQLRISDRPTAAIRLLAVLARIAWFQLRYRGLRTVRPYRDRMQTY